MELSEKMIRMFELEGFTSIYEWQDPAHKVYPAHVHRGKVSLYVTDGSITFDFSGVKKVVKANERFDVPVGVEHSALVGPEGWRVVVAEEIDGDS